GAVITYHLKDALKTKKQQRKDAEAAALKKGELPPYPSREELRAEAEEEEPAILLTIMDADGKPIRTLTGPVTAGFQRVAWDLREAAPLLAKAPAPDEVNPWDE